MASGPVSHRFIGRLLLACLPLLAGCHHGNQSDPGSSGGSSNPVPSASALSPTSTAVGSPTLTLEVTGSDFVGTSVIQWNGAPLATAFINDSALTATVPATLLTATGSATVTVVTPAPGGGTSGALAFTITPTNPQPSISSLSPASAAAGSPALVLVVKGSDFVPASTVQWNGSNLATSFVSANELSATLPAADLAAAGSASVTVASPAPGGGTSAAAAFTITSTNPLPSVSSLSPSSAAAGSPQFTLTVSGSDFVSSSSVLWNGNALATTFVSASTLTAVVPVGDVATAGSAAITVSTPAPGGGTSNAATFTITPTNPVPSINSIAPTSAAVGSTAVTLTVNGSDFVAASQVRWNGSTLSTTYVSAAKLTALVPASDLLSAGSASVTVFNPTPGGGTSGSASFSITATNPAPSLTALSPANAAAGSPALTLQVSGSGYIGTSTVKWNGSSLTTTYASATKLTALVPASDLAAAGNASVTVTNPAPGGGTSSAATFTITQSNPAPSLGAISPSSAAAGSTALTLTVSGSNFVAASTIDWNGSALATTFVSSTQLTALVPASDLTTAGSASVTVVTPAPGGGTSGAATFTINPTNPAPGLSSISPASASAGSAALTLTVTGSNFVASSTVNWSGTALTTTYVSATELTAFVPASELASVGTASVTVVNPAPGGGTSSAASFSVTATNPVPSITALSPSSAAAGSAALTLTVSGSKFVAASVVDWNGAPLATTYVSAAQLTATVAASDLATAGTASVTVVNPAPGGGTSGSLAFTVNATNPAPTLATLSPSSALAGANGFTLTVGGSNFVASSVVQWNGAALVTTFVSASALTAAVPASDISAAGNASITVVNPAPGGGTSAAVAFTINATNPAPSLGTLAPASATVNSAGFNVTVTGSGFISSSVVNWNGSALATNYVSATELTAAVPSSDLASTGSASVTVVNPAPGGGTSSAATFTISPASTSGPAVRQVVTLTGGQTHSGGGISAPWNVTITVLQGSTLWVLGTIPIVDNVLGTGPYTYPNIEVTDSGGNKYTNIARADDPNYLSDAIAGTQALISWTAVNVPAGTYTVSMLPGVGTNNYFEDWVAVAAVEITGVSSFDSAGHSLLTQVPAGSNSVSAVATSTVANSFIIAACFDDESSLTHPGTPAAGSAYTDQGAYWLMVSGGVPTLRIESATAATPGVQTATFSPTEGADSQLRYPDYLTVMAIFH